MLNKQLTKEKQKRRLKTLPLTAAVIALLRVSACSSKFLTTANSETHAAPTVATAKTNTPKLPIEANTSNVPSSLSDISQYGEAIYDMAKIHDWTKAAVELASLKDAIARLHSDFKGVSKDEAQLDISIAALDIAVATKERSVAMHLANQLTLIAANMIAQLNPPLSVECSS